MGRAYPPPCAAARLRPRRASVRASSAPAPAGSDAAPTSRSVIHSRAVRQPGVRVHLDALARDARVRADRRVAARVERLHDGALGVEARARDRVRDRERSSSRDGARRHCASSASSPWPGAGTNASGVERRAGLVARGPAGAGRPAPARRVALALRRACAGGCRRCRAAARPRRRRACASSCERRRRLEVPTRAPCGQRVDRASRRRARRAGPRRRARPRSRGRRAARPAGPWRCAPRGRSRRRAAPPRSPSRTATCRRGRRSPGRRWS